VLSTWYSVASVQLLAPKDQGSVKMACPRGRTSFPLCFVLMICLMAQLGASNVVLMANNTTLSFDDVEATFSECYTLLHYVHVSLYMSIAIWYSNDNTSKAS